MTKRQVQVSAGFALLMYVLLVVITGQHRRDTIDYLDKCLRTHAMHRAGADALSPDTLMISSDEWFFCVENAREMSAWTNSDR